MADTRTPGRSISRRTLAKGAGWSVPTVALASAAPALASSIQVPPTITIVGACKYPGGSCEGVKFGYRFTLKICNPSPVDIWIHSLSSTITDRNGKVVTLGWYNSAPALPAKIPASGGCVTVVYRATGTNSSNEKDFTATVTAVWDHTQDQSDIYDHTPAVSSQTYDSTPPNCCGTEPASATSSSSSSSTSSSSSSPAAPASTQAPAPASKSAAPASEAPTSTAAPSGS